MRVDRWFAFVDLAGFTSFGDEFGDDESVRVLTMFRGATREVATEFGVRIAKWLGDGCMIVSVDPEKCIRSVCRLEEAVHEVDLPLQMHAGCAGGAVILLEGDDYTGRAVNLAARLAGVATAHEILAPVDMAEHVPDGTPVVPAGMVTVAGLHDPIDVIRFGVCGGERYGSHVTAYETLDFTRDGFVGWLRLNRPDKLNSFTIQMWDELRTIGAELRDDPELRALVVIGNGRAFSSGIDTTVFTTPTSPLARDEPTTHESPTVASILRTGEGYNWLETARYPTIAAVRGYALGAGLQLALACDLRVFARGTSVGLLEHKYGILPDLGGTQRLPRVVGAGKAKEMIWTAARIDAEESYRIGLCEKIVDDAELETVAGALAATIAAQPPLAVQGAKRVVDAAGVMPIAEGLVVEAEAQAACLTSDDMREAIGAFVESRVPDYKGK